MHPNVESKDAPPHEFCVLRRRVDPLAPVAVAS